MSGATDGVIDSVVFDLVDRMRVTGSGMVQR